MDASRPWPDDELASLDVVALLRDGPPDELLGRGLAAAAIQLERAGIVAGDVFQTAEEVRADDVLAGEPPTLLDRMVAAGAQADWLERVAELMVLRLTSAGSP